ncbi:MAG TPA: S8 family serine peptidase [Gaiellaceae bacterium]|nr:S8 family serine peptidase [Gaiellaceae bacterium]
MRRSFGELQIPRLRAGAIVVPKSHARGRVTVLVTLNQPPLAARFGRSLAAAGGARTLDVRTAASRAYLAELARVQSRAEAALRKAIPQATVSRKLRVILDALTVELPVAQLPKLYRLGFVHKVYPSMRFSLSLDDSPAMIGATAFTNATGADGKGIKIAVVDDGIDQKNAFFDPTGYAYPAGFPRGQTAYTTPKVIVAKSYPGPGAGKAERLPFDPKASFHGTHVAGIAAGDAGTTAPAGPDHPEVKGLSGVAPRAWLGSYRVFNVPTPVGNSAFTPQIVAAFEDAVADGMNVINFSGGGPMNDPANDALVEAVHNVVLAGVVPVISAGNDRDDFGLGSVGAPGTAPDAISVAAVSNTHVFSPVLTVTSPAGLPEIPFNPGRTPAPPAWTTIDQKLVDVGAIVGTDKQPVDRYLCGPPGNVEAPQSTLPSGSLSGSIALVSRGFCTFLSKTTRAKAAGAVGVILVDNRPGEANGIPVDVGLPAGMIADADGTRLRAALAPTGGRATVRIGRNPVEIQTGRGGTPTSFSSAGLTPFTHDLKPDLSAPGGAILSSTVASAIGESFAVFDGTSMAAPHVAGAAALLLQRHPTWGSPQVKTALMSTAGPAWGDTGRTTEASVLLEGAGLIDVGRADDPQIFTDPPSLSFRYLNVNRGSTSRPLLTTLSDAGGGFGTWKVELQSQSATAGAMLDLPAEITIQPGGDAFLTAVARAAADAAVGDDYGFIVLRKGDVTRRIPYEFSVERPGLESVTAKKLQTVQIGDTRAGPSRVGSYRWPAAPFGPAASYFGPPLSEDGAEQLYVYDLAQPAVNLGVAVVLQSANSLIDPFFLASQDENDVTGYTGTPVNVNAYLPHYHADVQAAGIQFPRQGQYFVAVDSGHNEFTGAPFAGQYVLRSWLNDVAPPLAAMVTTTIAAGRPTIVARTLDLQSGVDPLSLVIGYGRVSVGAAAYDPVSGFAVFPLPAAAPALKKGNVTTVFVAGDFQEDKNVDQAGEIESILPNTAFVQTKLKVVDGPTVNWLFPERNQCATAPTRLLVVAGATKKIRDVRFAVGGKRIATVKRGAGGLYSAAWSTKGLKPGTYTLQATVTDAAGATKAATRTAKVCGKKK